jgi:hypothetical protein
MKGLIKMAIDFFEQAMAQVVNNMNIQSNLANQMFISTMAGNLAVHSRCGQVIDKRVAEFDIEENRALSSIDPTTQAFMLARAGQDNGATNTQTAQLIEILRQVQSGRK